LDVDKLRKRIALTLRLDDEVGRNPSGTGPVAARAEAGPRAVLTQNLPMVERGW